MDHNLSRYSPKLCFLERAMQHVHVHPADIYATRAAFPRPILEVCRDFDKPQFRKRVACAR